MKLKEEWGSNAARKKPHQNKTSRSREHSQLVRVDCFARGNRAWKRTWIRNQTDTATSLFSTNVAHEKQPKNLEKLFSLMKALEFYMEIV